MMMQRRQGGDKTPQPKRMNRADEARNEAEGANNDDAAKARRRGDAAAEADEQSGRGEGRSRGSDYKWFVPEQIITNSAGRVS
jgi:hypothetical protein